MSLSSRYEYVPFKLAFRTANPLLYYAQRLVTLAPCRAAISQGIAAAIRRTRGAGPEWTGNDAENEIVAEIEREFSE